MSYTLRGRLESRFAGALPALVLALAVHRWWAIELIALMLAIGVVLDLGVYHRALAYQPGWAAVPLGALELAALMGAARALGIDAPLGPAVGLYAFAWVAAQVLGQAVFPRFQLSYAEDGGELRRAGPIAAATVAVVLASSAGVAYAMQPPTVHLSSGSHGPLLIDRAQTLVGRPGAIVHGGIRIRASHVTIRNVTVVGGEYGIDIENARQVTLDGVHVIGATLDGIHARHSLVTIRDCSVTSPGGAWTQAIDLSFAGDLGMSTIERCDLSGGREGIVTHFSHVLVRDNRVHGTALRGITMGEMSMGMIHGNDVTDSLGVGIFCVDSSECEIERNMVSGTRPDRASGDLTRQGYAIEAHYNADATLRDNTIVGSPGGIGSFAGSTVRHR